MEHNSWNTNLGTQIFVEEFVMEKVSVWKTKLKCLSLIAKSEPYVAFSAFTHGLIGHWMYRLRTVEELPSLMQPLKGTIRHAVSASPDHGPAAHPTWSVNS